MPNAFIEAFTSSIRFSLVSIFLFLTIPFCESSIYGAGEESNPIKVTSENSQLSKAEAYFDTAAFSNESQNKLLMAASGQLKVTGDEASQWIRQYSSSQEHARILELYSSELLRLLNYTEQNSEVWYAANSKLLKGITNYVGDSGDGEKDEEGPDWMSINRKLRSKQEMTKEEKQFFDEIEYSIRALPQVKGLVFRGQRLTPQKFDEIAVGKTWKQEAFTSTSLNFDVAASFGAGQAGYSKTGVLIMKIKRGAPVSVLTFDYGFQGQPGRVFEHEILLPSGQDLLIHHKIDDQKNNRYLIFAEQL